MASLEEEMAIVFSDPVAHVLAKGKRTKRSRSLLFCNNTSGESDLTLWQPDDTSESSPESSADGMTSEEEEDMANCLILLAQGQPRGLQRSRESVNTTTTRAATAISTASAYQCKTCSKMFSSFQALGGHRASHKKPKLLEIERRQLSSSTVVVPNHRSRPHECSFCGAEFATGQALGGHMRRHRGAAAVQQVPGGRLLALDLNLPAPEEEGLVFREVKVEEKRMMNQCSSLVFTSTAALVDCHY